MTDQEIRQLIESGVERSEIEYVIERNLIISVVSYLSWSAAHYHELIRKKKKNMRKKKRRAAEIKRDKKEVDGECGKLPF